MMEKVPLFNPAQLEKEDLFFYFTGREGIEKDILKDLGDSVARQHYLIIGSRGMGKTYLLLVILNRVKDSPKLSKNYIPIPFLEEQPYMTTIEDLLYWILKTFNDKEGGDVELRVRGKETYESLYEKIAQIRRRGKRFLLLFDNFDKFVKGYAKAEIEQKKLRRILITEDFFTVIATAPSFFEELEMYEKPLYRHFAPVYLKGLASEEILELIKKRAERDENEKILKKIETDEFERKIKAITEMTGGLPRIVHLLYDLVSKELFLDVIKTFGAIVDSVSYYYIARLEELSPQQRKIIDSIARLENRATPKQISEFTGEKISAVTGQLKRLKDLNVVKVAGEGRKRYYSISEYLLYLWYVMRYLGMKKQPYIVKFLELWYGEEELTGTAQRYFEAISHHASMGDYKSSYNYAVGLSYVAEALPDEVPKLNAVEGFLKTGNYHECIDEIEPLLEKGVKKERKAWLLNNYGRCLSELGYLDRALEHYETSLKINEELGQKEGIASDYGNIGIVSQIKGALNKAMEYYEKSLKINEELGRKEEMASTYSNIGTVYGIRGELDKALECYEKSLKINEGLSRMDVIASVYGNIGNVHQTKGDLDKALECYEKSLKINEELDRKEETATAYGNIGVISQIRGELDKATGYFEKALKINEELGRKGGIARDYGNIGVVYLIRGELDKATGYFEKALKIEEELGRKEGMANQYGNIGNVYGTKGDLDKAIEYYGKSLEIEEELGRKEGIATAQGNTGNIYQVKGDLNKAMECYEKSLKINKELGRKEGIALAYGNIGTVYGIKGEFDKATGYFEKALKIEEELGRKEGMANQYGNIGNVYGTKGDLDKALECYETSLKINKELGRKKEMASDYSNIGIVYQIKGELNKAMEYYEMSIEMFKQVGGRNIEITTANLAAALFQRGQDEASRNNFGNVKEDVEQALKILEGIEHDIERKIRVLFVGVFGLLRISPEFVLSLEEVIEKGLGEHGFVVEPFILASKYMTSSEKERKKLLDGIDPKIAKIVEDIVSAVQKKN